MENFRANILIIFLWLLELRNLKPVSCATLVSLLLRPRFPEQTAPLSKCKKVTCSEAKKYSANSIISNERCVVDLYICSCPTWIISFSQQNEYSFVFIEYILVFVFTLIWSLAFFPFFPPLFFWNWSSGSEKWKRILSKVMSGLLEVCLI